MALINGIDMDILENEVIKLSRKEPELFRKTFKAQTTWNNATSVTMKAENNELLVNCGCENPFACGMDPNRAFNPLEVALGSLGACMTVAYAAFAALMGITVKDLRVEIEGDMDVGPLYHVEDESPLGFSQMRMNVFIDSNATEDQLRELDELAQRKSPILNMVTQAKPMETHIHSTATA